MRQRARGLTVAYHEDLRTHHSSLDCQMRNSKSSAALTTTDRCESQRQSQEIGVHPLVLTNELKKVPLHMNENCVLADVSIYSQPQTTVESHTQQQQGRVVSM